MTVTTHPAVDKLDKLEEHTNAIKDHVTSKFKELDDYLDPKLSWAQASRYTPLIVAAFGIAFFCLGWIVRGAL